MCNIAVLQIIVKMTADVILFLQLSWLRVDFNKWKNWEDDSDDENEKFDQFSDVSRPC